MLRKSLITIGVIVVLLIVAFFYLNNRNRTLSPPGSASLTNGDLTLSVSYSRPSVRDRLIFGTRDEGALQPYGVYWRLGANEATEITVNQDFSINDQALKKGTYRMYAIPGVETFEIRLNSELGQWGFFEPSKDRDLLLTSVPVTDENPLVEQFTIRLEKVETDGINLIFEWSDVRFEVPVFLQK